MIISVGATTRKPDEILEDNPIARSIRESNIAGVTDADVTFEVVHICTVLGCLEAKAPLEVWQYLFRWLSGVPLPTQEFELDMGEFAWLG